MDFLNATAPLHFHLYFIDLTHAIYFAYFAVLSYIGWIILYIELCGVFAHGIIKDCGDILIISDWLGRSKCHNNVNNVFSGLWKVLREIKSAAQISAF